jgi:tetratricopeptide (TPR) repeat protein
LALFARSRKYGALVGVAAVDVTSAAFFIVNDRDARFAAAEATLIKALSMSPRHARAHIFLGAVQILTKRAAQGIRECERALALDRNLADAHGIIGWAKVLIGRGAEAEAHIQDAFRLSPRDTSAFRWMQYAGFTKLLLGADAEAVAWLRRCLEVNRNYPLAHFYLAAALALLGSLEEARDAVRAGLALDPTFTIRRTRGRMSDDPIFRAGVKRVLQGVRMAGVPEG